MGSCWVVDLLCTVRTSVYRAQKNIGVAGEELHKSSPSHLLAAADGAREHLIGRQRRRPHQPARFMMMTLNWIRHPYRTYRGEFADVAYTGFESTGEVHSGRQEWI